MNQDTTPVLANDYFEPSGKIALVTGACAAPDDGNMRVLEKIGTEQQKTEWLQPIIDGKVASAFAMTEPQTMRVRV